MCRNKYHISGYGRKVGALGRIGYFSKYIEAPSEEEAKIKIYDYYEHISKMNIRIVDESEYINY